MSVAAVSVIMPTLNEESAVAGAIESARGALEVIVVDGGSEDRTRDIAARAGARVIDGPLGRGLQLNAGAALARGDVLLFLHADTHLPPGFARAIVEGLTEHGAVWGRFDVRFDEGGPLLRLIAWLISTRSRLTRVGTGDQAIFVRREIFDQLGGFREALLFEDIDLCRRLKRRGRMVIPAEPVLTSSRRWIAGGAIRTSFLMWGLKLAYLAGVSSDRLARFYRDAR